jgi:hypothetical protein
MSGVPSVLAGLDQTMPGDVSLQIYPCHSYSDSFS